MLTARRVATSSCPALLHLPRTFSKKPKSTATTCNGTSPLPHRHPPPHHLHLSHSLRIRTKQPLQISATSSAQPPLSIPRAWHRCGTRKRNTRTHQWEQATRGKLWVSEEVSLVGTIERGSRAAPLKQGRKKPQNFERATRSRRREDEDPAPAFRSGIFQKHTISSLTLVRLEGPENLSSQSRSRSRNLCFIHAASTCNIHHHFRTAIYLFTFLASTPPHTSSISRSAISRLLQVRRSVGKEPTWSQMLFRTRCDYKVQPLTSAAAAASL